MPNQVISFHNPQCRMPQSWTPFTGGKLIIRDAQKGCGYRHFFYVKQKTSIYNIFTYFNTQLFFGRHRFRGFSVPSSITMISPNLNLFIITLGIAHEITVT